MNQDMHELLCAYLLDEVDDEQRARVEAALAQSPELAAEHERLAGTIALVRGTYDGGEALSDDARRRLVMAAEERARRGAPRVWYRSPMLQMAAGVLFAFVGYAGWRAWSLDAAPAPEVARFAEDGATTGRLDSREPARSKPEQQLAQAQAETEATVRRIAEAGDAARDTVQLDAETSQLDGVGYLGGESWNRLSGDGEAQDDEPAADPLLAAAEAVEEADDGDSAREKRSDDLVRARRAQREAESMAETMAEPTAEPAPQPSEAKLAKGAERSAGRAGDAPPPVGAPAVGGGAYAGPEDSVSNPPAPGAASRAAAGPGSPGRLSAGGAPSSPGPSGPSSGSDDFFLGHGAAPRVEDSVAAETVSGKPAAGFFLADDDDGAEFEKAVDTLWLAGNTGPELETLRALGLPGEALREAIVPAPNDAAAHDGTPKDARRYDDGRGRYLVDCDVLVDRFVQSCRRRPHESPSAMFFRYWGDNAFETALLDSLSTFSIDVDTQSYALARRYLEEGHVPTKEQVRTEEFVNAFRPDVPPPIESTFAIDLELAPSRFGDAQRDEMLRVVVRGEEVERTERPPLALTFVVDTSGSMSSGNRIELVKHGLRLLVGELDQRDTVALVAFSNDARLMLKPTSAGQRAVIESAIHGLSPNGSTNADAGLRLGYAQAAAMHAKGTTNRVVLFSDGVANTGQTDQNRILESVKEQRAKGIYLNCFGVGMGNHNDVFLEQLANKGDGLCHYIDSEAEARRRLVEEFTSTLETIARDVKIQVEFDPEQVDEYRLLGYENRAVADKDFRNDAIDAGEVGAGHQVTALYEIRRSSAAAEGPLATVRLRWKAPFGEPGEDEAMEIERSIGARDAAGTFEGTTPGYRRAVIVAQFAELLRRSVHARGESLDELIAEAERLRPELAEPGFDELVALLKRSRELIASQLPSYDELTRALDSVRRNYWLRAKVEELENENAAELLAEYEKQNRELEEKLRELLRERLQQR